MQLNFRFLTLTILLVLGLAVMGRGTTAHAQNTIYCASDDGKRNYCSADTRGGVQMTQQRSGSACIQGQTWGWDNNRIWVDRGCRADFVTRSGSTGSGWGNGGNNNSGTIYCASDDGKRNYCNANTRGGVQMTQQRSGSACIQGQTWGADNNRIWVDRGCRADFTTGNGNGGGGWGGGNGWGGGGNNNSGTIYCASDDGKRNYCNTNTRGGVRMTQQRSGSACIQGQTWGADNNRIWVDRGCRADFTTGNGNGGGWGGGNGGNNGAGATFSCSSDDGRRHTCSYPSGTIPKSVSIVQQRSGSPCIKDQTWGWNEIGVWVDKGCRADFRNNR